jgi:microcystin-dependent protein
MVDDRLHSRNVYEHGEGTESDRWRVPDSPEGCRSYLINLPDDPQYHAMILGAISRLASEDHYSCSGDRAAAAAAFHEAILSFTGYHGMVTLMQPGDIKIAAGTQTDSWLFCDGEAYQIDDYALLHAAIGTAFGEDGAGTFRVPDLRDRFPIGAGLALNIGDTGGEAEHTLTVDEIPEHNHSVEVPIVGAGLIGEIPASVIDINPFGTTGNTGGGSAHNNMPPYLALGAWIFTGVPECAPPCEPAEPAPPGMQEIFVSTSNIDGDVILPITEPGFYRIDMRGVSNDQGDGWTFVSMRPQAGTLAAWREWLEGFNTLSFGSDETAQTSTFVRAWLPQSGAPGPTRQMHMQVWIEVTGDRLFTRWNTAVVQSAASAAQRMGAMRGNSISLYTDLSSGIRVLTTSAVARWHRIHVWREA